MSWIRVDAPSNIALIKYMGKMNKDGKNLPANSSVSMTLSNLLTTVEIRTDKISSGNNEIIFENSELSEAERQRTLDFCFSVLPEIENFLVPSGFEMAPRGRLLLKSQNSFPKSAGLASSASAFAALTFGLTLSRLRDPQEFWRKFSENFGEKLRIQLAALSQKGSGSSCRSFLGPWVKWQGNEIEKISCHSSLESMTDLMLIVSENQKKISSSEAHQRVKTSPLWEGRSRRTESRTQKLLVALRDGDLAQLAEISWEEMWDMHSLFHTSSPWFSYLEPLTLELLKFLRTLQPVPILTLDAGPNIHILAPSPRIEEIRHILKNQFPMLNMLASPNGSGVRMIACEQW